jgi:receptor protein-tyrosine kinase/non-specific protein-tyrosine kinase
MSKIEKALEQAVKMRESAKGVVPEATMASDDRVCLANFEVGEAGVDMSRIDQHLVCVADSNSFGAEQYRKLWARLLRATKNDFLNTIMVTSADMGEGKTVTAINLAVTMANAIDYTVLLVDADLRNPTIHKYLGIAAKYGLSDYLSGKKEIPDILIKTGIGRLVLLPGGNPLENPAEMLSSERMKKLVEEMKHMYRDRYVIFDSSPVLVTADSLSLSGYMDGVLFVVQADHTSEKAVTQAISLMKGSNILGVVLNSMPQYLEKKRHYPYYSYRTGASVREPVKGNGGNGNDQNEKKEGSR